MTTDASSMNAHQVIRSGAAVAAALVHLVLPATRAAAQDTVGEGGRVRDSAQAVEGAAGGLRLAVITTGGAHTCGLTAEGAAYCWGSNRYGQLGDSSMTDRATPVPVGRGRVFREISAGEGHTCAVTVENVPFCWGRNDGGTMGIGASNRPYPVTVIGNIRAATISAGGLHSCLVDLRAVAHCWGRNGHGQLGSATDEDASSPVSPFGVRSYRAIVAGNRHTCAITVGGKVLCWGANERGQLGNSSRTGSLAPFAIRVSNNRIEFAAVAVGAAHSCAIEASGAAHCWGDNTAGQLGIGSNKKMSVVPVPVAGDLRFTSVTAAGQTTCGVTEAGEVYCWGSNAEGQFGDGPAEGSRTPIRAAEAFAPVALSLGGGRACGLARDGAPSCWGRGTSEQTGGAPADR